MGIKKRSQVSAEFNMSSLTDIIFLLLIFFMLTSSLVNPNALNLKLPGKSNTNTVSATDDTPQVIISQRGDYSISGKNYSKAQVEAQLRKYGGKTIIIAPNRKAPIEAVASIMDMAMRFNINAILAADE